MCLILFKKKITSNITFVKKYKTYNNPKHIQMANTLMRVALISRVVPRLVPPPKWSAVVCLLMLMVFDPAMLPSTTFEFRPPHFEVK